MVTKPPIDELTEKAGDKYTLCCTISKRAKELNNTDEVGDNNPISYAALEFGDDITEVKK